MKALRFLGIALMACSMLFVSCKKDKQFTITVNVNDPAMGTVTGGGTYDENATATLTATAKEGYQFVKWNDGNTSNPRTITVTKDETYTAHFEALPAGVYVTFGSDKWTAGDFCVDADVYSAYNKLYVFIFKTSMSDGYPQFQGIMSNAVGTTTQADNDMLLYVGSTSEIDAEGHVQWATESLETTVTAIDLTAHTISANQTGKLNNSVTSESRDLKVVYSNAEWTPVSVQSKGALVKF